MSDMTEDTEVHPLSDLMPTDPLMVMPWAACLQWAIRRPDIIEAFQAETGNVWTPGNTPLDRMIDEACGADLAWLREFVKWHNLHIWGDLDLVAGEESDEA